MRLNRHLQKLRIPQLKIQKFQETNVTLIQPQIDFPFECRETIEVTFFFELMALSFGCGRRADNVRLICKFDDSIYSNQMNIRSKKKKTVAAQERRKNFVQLMELRFFTCMVYVFKVHAFTKRTEIRRGDKGGTVWSKMRKFSTTPLALGYRFVSGIMRRNLDQCLINGGLTLIITLDLLLSGAGHRTILGICKTDLKQNTARHSTFINVVSRKWRVTTRSRPICSVT